MSIINHEDFINNIYGDIFGNNSEKSPKKSYEYIFCPNCNITSDENDIKEFEGNYVCVLCGLILKQRVSETAEWSNYTDSSGYSSNNSRCGSGSKTTDINPFYIDINSSFIPKGVKNICYEDGIIKKYDISKLHIKSSFNHLHKSFNNVENLLDNITNDKYSKRIVNTAKMLWAEIMKTKKVTRAGVRKGLIACCLYYSCVHYDTTRSPLEICLDFGMEDTKQFNKGDKEFKEIFENIQKWAHLIIKTSNSDDYFSRFCSDLEVNHVIKEGIAFQLANDCRVTHSRLKDDMFELFPKSAACGILLWTLKKNNIHVTKTSLSKILGICSPSLTKCYNTIDKLLSESLSTDAA